MYRLYIILLALCALPQQTAASLAWENDHYAAGYRLNDLAMAVVDEHVMLRTDLARIALAELATVYDEEAAQARRDLRRHKKKSGSGRWIAAVQGLADDYARLADSIRLTTPVDIRIGPENSLYLTIDGRLVAVSSPRMNEQAEFEQRVIEQFCTLNRCDGLLDEPDLAVIPARALHAGQTRWSFSESAGPVCETDDGLQFQFMNLDNLGRKREACAQTVAELNALATVLERKVSSGVRVDWKDIMIRTLPDGDEYISLNREGDYIQHAFPVLAQRRDLFRVVRPWLAARAKGTSRSIVVLHAGRLLGPPGYPLE